MKKIKKIIKENFGNKGYKSLKIVALLLLIWIIFLITYPKSRDFNILVQIFIFGALLWYSFETKDLKDINRKIYKSELRPILDLYLRRDKTSCFEYFAIRNIGKGVAYNIKVSDIKIRDVEMKFYFDQANAILAPLKDEKMLKVYSKEVDTKTENIKELLRFREVNEKNIFLCFLIEYQGVFKDLYYSIFKFYIKGGISKEFVIEFIENKKGTCMYEEAYKKCQKIAPQDSIYFNF